MSVLISDIAKKVGVSNATVSNALNDRPGVSKQKRKEIIDAAREMGYFKKRVDSSKRFEFLVVSSQLEIINDPAFFSDLIKSVETASYANKMEVVIRYIDVKDLTGVLGENNLNENTSGYIILATELKENDLSFLRTFNRPFVILDAAYHYPEFTCVVINNRDSAYFATKHLINNGHREIGIITSCCSIENFKERERGFLDSLSAHCISYNEEYWFDVEPTLEGSYEGMKKILDRNPKLPTALFIVNDTIAFGVNKALIEANQREGISMVGFDDIPLAVLMDPPLTTVKVDKTMLGTLAVEQLMLKLNNGSKTNIKIQVNTSLIIRDSVDNLE